MHRYVRWISRQGRCVVRACNGRNAVIATGIILIYYYWSDGTRLLSKESLHAAVQNASLLKSAKSVHEVFRPTILEVGSARGFAIQGRRYSMEDRMDAWVGELGIRVFGVYDGHAGEFTVDYIKDSMRRRLEEHLEKDGLNEEKIKSILRTQILETDEELLQQLKKARNLSGSTLLIAVLAGSTLIVANVGDSRGVLCMTDGSVVPLSTDHKPNLPKERRRIEEAGGFISNLGVWRVGGMLAMSRAMGDLILKQPGHITAEPDCQVFDVTNARFFILATDGLWDVFSNEEAAAFVHQRISEESATFASDSLTIEAFKRGSTDNISVLIVKIEKEK